ncbi:hypothetical protein [Streptomyces zaomyceticus]|uniref:hypothetical protein n=1 Tax=Streptomyces zaomyceticus TaxID=68286 RepID=UPI0037B23C6A
MTDKPSRSAIRVDDPNAPIEGSDAGPAAELVRERMELVVRRYRRQAKQAHSDAQRSVKDVNRALEFIDESLMSAARAFWWAEGSLLEEKQHQLMHQIGRWKRRNLGCSLAYDGANYTQRCPVAIAHKKMGFSIGFTATRFCSICREDLSSDRCSHFRDRVYWVTGGVNERGPCRVCCGDSCGHRSDTLYRAQVISVVDESSEMKLHEVSIVRKPAQPEARLSEIPIDIDDLANVLGPHFLPGITVSCDKCLDSCAGFTELSADEI